MVHGSFQEQWDRRTNCMKYYKEIKIFETREEIIQELQERLPTWDNEEFWKVQLWSDLVAMYEQTEKQKKERSV